MGRSIMGAAAEHRKKRAQKINELFDINYTHLYRK